MRDLHTCNTGRSPVMVKEHSSRSERRTISYRSASLKYVCRRRRGRPPAVIGDPANPPTLRPSQPLPSNHAAVGATASRSPTERVSILSAPGRAAENANRSRDSRSGLKISAALAL